MRSRRLYIGKKKKRGDYLVILLEALIQLDRKVGADTLKYLHDNDEQDNSQQHDQILVAVIAGVNGEISQIKQRTETPDGLHSSEL